MLKSNSKKGKTEDLNKSKNLDAEKFISSRYWIEIKRDKRFFFSPLIFLLGYLASTTIVPIFYSQLIQDATEGKVSSLSDVILPASILCGLYLFKSFSYFVETRIFTRMVESAQKALALESFQKISSMSKSFFADRFTGSLVGQANPYSLQVRDFANQWQYSLLPSVASTIVMLGYISTKSFLLAVPLVLSSVVYAFVMFKNRKKMRLMNKAANKAANDYSGKLSDSIGGMEAVKADGAEVHELKNLKPFVEKFTKLRRKSINFNNTQGELINFLNQFFILISLLFTVYLFIEGKIELSTVILMSRYASSIIGNVATISRFKLNLQGIYAGSYEMAEIMMLEPGIQDPEIPTSLKINKGLIEFNNANFKYSDSTENIEAEDEGDSGAPKSKNSKLKKLEPHLFKDLNLIIQPGEKIGLVGPSGGGKSTLLKLILRFYDVDSGEVKIDGINIKDVIQSKLRQQIAYVPQDPALFHRSILENIGYSKPKATKKQIESAAHQAFADEFINDLPKGYDTLVGERGVKLSGGQRQRVAIARAILKDAPILLLDEATSALDSESEKYIQKSLQKLIKGRTTVVVAHRLSTIQNMDRILVIEKGRVVDSGSHRELLSSSPLYQKLWSHQSGGML